MFLIPALVASLLAASGCQQIKDRFGGARTDFDSQAAMKYAKTDLDFGPRVPGTPAHEKAGDWIVAQMKQRTDSVIVQSWTQTTANGTKLPMRNIIARFNPTATQRVLYLTHWDTRPTADEDSNLGARAGSFPSANDGAAEVGMFIALGDLWKKEPPSVGVDLLFTDGEDWGGFDPDSTGAYPDALFGSQYFANHIPWPNYTPLYGVLFDMIADRDLQIYQEPNSVQAAPEVVNQVWKTAADLGYSKYFISEPGEQMTDDHVPLIQKKLRVIDLIDWQYGPLPAIHNGQTPSNPSYHHTTQDTFDKISAKSLQIVGDVAVTLVK
jgi:hypothetical protein